MTILSKEELPQSEVFDQCLRAKTEKRRGNPPARGVSAVESCVETPPPNRTSGEKVGRTRESFLNKSDVPPRFAGLSESVIQCSLLSVNTLLELLFIHGLSFPSTEMTVGTTIGFLVPPRRYRGQLLSSASTQLIRCLDFCLANDSPGAWIKYWKYKSAAYFASIEGQELMPVRPPGLSESDKPHFIFGGVISEFMRGHNVKYPGELSLAILMFKKGAPRPGQELLEQASVDSYLKLTTEAPVNECFDLPPQTVHYHFWNGMFGEEHARWQFQRTVREIFTGKTFGPSQMSKPTTVSKNGNYNRTRGKYGSVPLVQEAASGIDFGASYVDGRGVFFDPVNLEYGEKGESREHELFPEMNETKNARVCDQTAFRTAFRTVYWRCFKKAMTEDPLVEIVPLPEALKIRTISKGPPFTYFVLRSLQKFMWKALKNLPCFELIGRPVTVEDVERVCGTACPWILSGDYQAATDNFRKFVSETILDEIALVCKFPPQLRELALRALTRHKIVDPRSVDNPELVIEDQKTGQLMGSIISFPILCIANAALCRVALECADSRRYSLRNAPLLINGDDCLLASENKQIYTFWQKITRVAGLEESVGKTYLSHGRLAVINSVTYDLKTSLISGKTRWVERKYVNMGLIKGMLRSGEADDMTPHDCAVRYNKLMDSIPERLANECVRAFMAHNRSKLSEFEGAWNLPEYAGGLGMHREVSEFDRMVLREIQKHHVQRVASWPLSGTVWNTRRIANDYLRESFPLIEEEQPYSKCLLPTPWRGIPYAYESGQVIDLEKSEKRLEQMLVWKVLLCLPAHKLVSKTKDIEFKQAAKRNKGIYDAARLAVLKKPCKPVPEEFVWEERKKGYRNVICV